MKYGDDEKTKIVISCGFANIVDRPCKKRFSKFKSRCLSCPNCIRFVQKTIDVYLYDSETIETIGDDIGRDLSEGS